ncbi:hypothetical protein OG900_33155 [Streptomyces sp. NBC_00433]
MTVSATTKSVRPFLSPVGEAALSRLVADTEGWFPVAAGDEHPSQEDEALRRVREHRDAIREGKAAYEEWAATAA